MIDDSDGDWVMAAAGGPIGCLLIACGLAVILYLIAMQNEKDCSKRSCRDGTAARLLDHRCVCVEEAK